MSLPNRTNSTSYEHPQETNLLNLHKAMEYNNLGQPVLRVKTNYGGGSSGGYNDSPSIDAFGRLRVGQPHTLFDSSFRYGDDTYKWNYTTSGNATVSHLANESSMKLEVGTAAGDSIIRETSHVFKYQPGKSLLILATFAMNVTKTGLRQRVGYFGANDGIYFEVSDDVKYLVIRKSITGSVDDTTERIPQSAWNVDTLDGTNTAVNPSGILLSQTGTQIFWTDVEWLGVGSVRCGFVINGLFILCHIFNHANNGLTSVYMKSATLPIRYEITNTSNTSGNSSLKQICSTVISEGGYENRSVGGGATTALTGKACSNTAPTPLVAFRLKSTHLDAVVSLKNFTVYGLQQAAYNWVLVLNPTLNAGNVTFVSSSASSAVEYNVLATGMTGGTVIARGIFVGDVKGAAVLIKDSDIDGSLQLGRTIGGVSDIFVLAAQATTNNDVAAGSVTWQEHT